MIKTFLSKNEILRIARLTPAQVQAEIAEWNQLWLQCYKSGDAAGKAEAKAMAGEIQRVYDQVKGYAKMEAEVIALLESVWAELRG